jgi:UDP-GlcNAc:undecaprenyl-phosphate/decaprenyl-phosphate GlcNAc-1-phosphate transferase
MNFIEMLEEHVVLVLVASLVSAAIALIIVRIKFLLASSMSRSLAARQASHKVPTPRLGGLAILIGILATLVLGLRDFNYIVFLAVLPVFLSGLLEDFGYETSPKLRLLVMAISAVIVTLATGEVVSSVDVDFADKMFALPVIGLIFTIFAVVGLTNGVNLIDGVNGLASSKVIFASLALSYVAAQQGDTALFTAALLIVAATLGVFVVNFPFGRIFMGDAGAYSLGFILAWIVILLNERHPEISAWSLLCIISWPIFDTVFAIIRRLKSGAATDRPDHLHFHQLVMRAWELISAGQMPRSVSNPLATVTIWPLTLPTIVLGAVYCEDNSIGIAVFFISAGLFWGSYASAMYVLRRRFLRQAVGHIVRTGYSLTLGKLIPSKVN